MRAPLFSAFHTLTADDAGRGAGFRARLAGSLVFYERMMDADRSQFPLIEGGAFDPWAARACSRRPVDITSRILQRLMAHSASVRAPRITPVCRGCSAGRLFRQSTWGTSRVNSPPQESQLTSLFMRGRRASDSERLGIRNGAARLLSKTYCHGYGSSAGPYGSASLFRSCARLHGVCGRHRGRRRRASRSLRAHPRVFDFSEHHAFPDLLDAGYGCMGANLRNLNNDSDCLHEKLLVDIAARL